MRRGDFQLGPRVGQGGMGVVHLAMHEPTGTRCAMKLLASDRAAHPRAVELFLREVRASARLDHPGILQVVDAGQHPEGPWFAMEVAEVGLDQRRPRTWLEVLEVLQVVLGALSHAHARGVVHRDIKPENLLYCRVAGHLHLRLGDFGIARLDHELRAVRGGTPGYMAPEQSRGSAVPSTDLFAVGVLAFELLTGARPFDGVPAAGERPPPLRSVMDVPEGVEAWVGRLLRVDPLERPGDALTVLRALDDVAAGRAPAWARPPLPETWYGATSLRREATRMGIGLAGLRPPPLVGRADLQDRLWERLREVAADGRAWAMELRAHEGEGGSRLGQWLVERAAELGARGGFVTEGSGPTDGLAGLSARMEVTGTPRPPDVSLLDAVLAQLEALGEGPTVLWIDGCTGDPDVQRLVSYLLGMYAGPLPVMLVLTTSPSAPWSLGRFACECVEVPALSLEDKTTALVYGLALDPATARAVAAHEPSLKSALDHVRTAVALGRVTLGEHGYALEPSGDDESKAASLLLTTVPPRALAALQVAALLGPVVDRALWGRACAAAGRAVRGAETEGLRRGVLRDDPGGRLTFAHHAIRDALVRSLFPGEARRLHAACAEALGSGAPSVPGRQAEHWLAAGRLEQAFEGILKALEKDAYVSDHIRWVELGESVLRSLQVAPSDLRWGRVWSEWVQVHLHRNSLDDLWQAVEQLRDWMDAHDGWARDPYLIDPAVRAAITRGRLDDAIRWLTPALQHLERSPSRLLRLHGLVMQQSSRYDEALVSFRRAMEHWPDDLSALTVMNDIAVCLESSGRYEEALEALRACLQLPGVDARLALVRVNIAGTLLELGRVPQAMQQILDLDPVVARSTDPHLIIAHGFAGTLGAALAGDDASFAVRAPRLGRLIDVTHFKDLGVARSYAAHAHRLRQKDRSAVADGLRDLANSLCRGAAERAVLEAIDPLPAPGASS